jgi:hypothetical protein
VSKINVYKKPLNIATWRPETIWKQNLHSVQKLSDFVFKIPGRGIFCGLSLGEWCYAEGNRITHSKMASSTPLYRCWVLPIPAWNSTKYSLQILKCHSLLWQTWTKPTRGYKEWQADHHIKQFSQIQTNQKDWQLIKDEFRSADYGNQLAFRSSVVVILVQSELQ